MAATDTSASTGKLRRDAGVIGLLFASTTSMIGSGWLFGAYHASKIAGPLSVWSWLIGAAIIMLIALCFAELSTMFSKSGALVHMSHASHGATLGRLWGWMLFLSYAPVPAVEAEGIVTYANNYLPYFIKADGSGTLTAMGFLASAVLLSVLALLNLLAIKALLRVNNTVTWWKIAVPLVTVVGLVVASTHWGVWHAAPGTYSSQGVFTAIPAAGIVFSFLGFRTAIDLGGESANPGRNIPMAVIGSVLLAAVVYVLLQVAFIMALSPDDLKGGWSHLNFVGSAGPFAGLAATLGMGWLAMLLYVDAYISPGGTGLIYITGGSRILYAVGDTDSGPNALTKTTGTGVPWLAVIVMWAVGVFFLLPFPAWQLLVGYISSITVLTYGLGPIVLMVLRRSQPDAPRAFRLRGAEILAPLAFVCSNLVIYWTGFYTDSILFAMLLVGFAIYAFIFHVVQKHSASDFGWGNIGWLAAWFGGIWVLSALGSTGNGFGIVGFWDGMLLVAIWSLVVIWLALRAALPAEETGALMERIQAGN
ncbi:amino acid permease [Thioclava dalianensis]|uniref:Amino acid permease n=1 Tax=Thioclava dalianensis TaxID=1185766 RepID=A0A074TJF2_9RHOB|nr:APC family permease [Thioclava dalianensis]KEP71739.1 amino acid permease [Thioclava dalianensis]SFN39981.1 Amino acid transporter [Thioclava dalianensis]